MKQDIHPDYKATVIKCACGATFETGSTKENLPSYIARYVD